MAKSVIRAVPAVFVPCTITGEPAADAESESPSICQRPARKKPEASKRPSTVIVVGTPVNQVGGSTIAVSVLGYVPTIGLDGPPVLFQRMIPDLPLPLRVAAVKPVTWLPLIRKLPPFAPAPM